MHDDEQMGYQKQRNRVALFTGIIFSNLSLLPLVQNDLECLWGPITDKSDIMPFDGTTYYEREMGVSLQRQFFVFEKRMAPDRLAHVKVKTNELERKYAVNGARRVNLDPGYITAAKIVLASTKNYAHRIYLGHGIFAELTLIYQHGQFQDLPWTYPDFRTDPYKAFFSGLRCRLGNE